MLRFENVATPLTAPRLSVPDSVAPGTLAPSATVTTLVNPLTTFPEASNAATWTGDRTLPASAVGSGWRTNPRWVTPGGGGGGGMTSIGVLVAATASLALARSV